MTENCPCCHQPLPEGLITHVEVQTNSNKWKCAAATAKKLGHQGLSEAGVKGGRPRICTNPDTLKNVRKLKK
jgi:hypothetical protein